MATFGSSKNDSEALLCANNCGFYGNANNGNLCSVCYTAFLKEIGKICIRRESSINQIKDEEQNLGTRQSHSLNNPLPKTKNRCEVCRKKIGLLGFNCRCEGLFCGKHRYPEEHSCDFDHKEIGRKNLAKQIVECKADKLDFRV